jgi:hypothetical protein
LQKRPLEFSAVFEEIKCAFWHLSVIGGKYLGLCLTENKGSRALNWKKQRRKNNEEKNDESKYIYTF